MSAAVILWLSFSHVMAAYFCCVQLARTVMLHNPCPDAQVPASLPTLQILRDGKELCSYELHTHMTTLTWHLSLKP